MTNLTTTLCRAGAFVGNQCLPTHSKDVNYEDLVGNTFTAGLPVAVYYYANLRVAILTAGIVARSVTMQLLQQFLTSLKFLVRNWTGSDFLKPSFAHVRLTYSLLSFVSYEESSQKHPQLCNSTSLCKGFQNHSSSDSLP